MLLRRGHLYLGLFLFPWAVLYGVTAFLFNHPTAFSDVPTTSISAGDWHGTELEQFPDSNSIAEQVVTYLNETEAPQSPYKLVGEAEFSGRAFAFATVEQDDQTINVLVDMNSGTGTIRVNPNTPEPVAKKPAPFARTAASRSMGSGELSGRGDRGRDGRGSQGISENESPTFKLSSPIENRIEASIPGILAHHGFANDGKVTVTSVPSIKFSVEADGATWSASYDPMKGTITGEELTEDESEEISVRRFLLRLHLSHGYPDDPSETQWFWAVIVDVMAFTMCFWGLSGLLMWWQIKSTRRLGAILLIVSASVAIALGFGMHAMLTGG